jgi:hypothetical protein
MNRFACILAVLLVSGCASDPAFTQSERISFALTPENVNLVQFWTVNSFQLRGAADLASDGVSAGVAGLQYREAITVKNGTAAVVVEMPSQTSVIVDVGLVLDPLNADLSQTLLLGFTSDENGLYTLRTVAGQPVGDAITIGSQEYAYYTCNGQGKRDDNPDCQKSLPTGAESDPSVTLRFKAVYEERESGVSGRYITP